MMGRQTGDQSQLFYLFNLERRIPASHLLRLINPIVTQILIELRAKLTPFYSEIGRPSIDPDLMCEIASNRDPLQNVAKPMISLRKTAFRWGHDRRRS